MRFLTFLGLWAHCQFLFNEILYSIDSSTAQICTFEYLGLIMPIPQESATILQELLTLPFQFINCHGGLCSNHCCGVGVTAVDRSSESDARECVVPFVLSLLLLSEEHSTHHHRNLWAKRAKLLNNPVWYSLVLSNFSSFAGEVSNREYKTFQFWNIKRRHSP